MDNDSSILPDINVAEMGRLSRRIVTARVMIFFTSGLCFLLMILFTLLASQEEDDNDASVCLTLSVIFLVLALYSLQKPLVSTVIAACMITTLFIYEIPSLFEGVNTKYEYGRADMLLGLAVTFIHAVILFSILRGSIAARKYDKIYLAPI